MLLRMLWSGKKGKTKKEKRGKREKKEKRGKRRPIIQVQVQVKSVRVPVSVLLGVRNMRHDKKKGGLSQRGKKGSLVAERWGKEKGEGGD